MRPYYADDLVTIYHADYRDVRDCVVFETLITDPPYPNNAGWFTESVPVAESVLASMDTETALVFWDELSRPPVALPLVAVHIWHRANVNGRPYEPVYHFERDGEKRRSEVYRTGVPFPNATGGEYAGHPTQKSLHLMRWLVQKTTGTVLDPFAGSGTTLVAAKSQGRHAIGVEVDERFCEVAARRCSQEVLGLDTPTEAERWYITVPWRP
jgi:hypothetical protein